MAQWRQSEFIFFFGGGAKFYRVDSRIQIQRYSRPVLFIGEGGPPSPSPPGGGIDATAIMAITISG